MPHDTWALTEGWLDEKAFLEQADMVLEERKKILSEELKNFKDGVFFFYIDTLDSIQHMFWRYVDHRHPLFIENSPYQDAIFEYYEKIDELLGSVLKESDDNTVLIVLSDHGFTSFRKAVHLNRWLLENGYLLLKEGSNESKEFFDSVDWHKTKAYALGFGGIYLNKQGREAQGIITEEAEEKLKEGISEKLRQWRDSESQEKIVKAIYSNEDIFNGPYLQEAPDLFVGFNSGFRASWQTALGAVPKTLIEDNKRKWSGDHLVDPSIVPGIIFINKKINLKSPSIIDLTPTILKLFSQEEHKEMSGKDICNF
jgi:predicted AlkP superfamily phosphohydrolase/phosphomutase